MKSQQEVPSYSMPQPQAIGFADPPSYASSVPPPPSSAPPYPSNMGSGAPPPLNAGYQPPPLNARYQPPPHAGYHPPPSAGYQPPPSAGYQPPPSAGYQPPLNAVNQPMSTTTYVYPSGPAHPSNVLPRSTVNPRTYGAGGIRGTYQQRKIAFIIVGSVSLLIMIISIVVFFTMFSRH